MGSTLSPSAPRRSSWWWLVAVYAVWITLLFGLLNSSGKGLLGVAAAILILFIWTPLYLYLNRNELWRKDRASTLAFAACVVIFFLFTWAVARHDEEYPHAWLIGYLFYPLMIGLFRWFQRLFSPTNETASRS